MRALLRSLSVALTILLVSTTSHAQITGTDPKPGEPTACPTITIEPARGMCPGWEMSQACARTVVTVVIRNTTTCTIPFLRVTPMPHSQGMNFSVCAPGYGVSRPNCGTDAVHVTLDQKPLQPGEIMEFQLMADREGDIEIYTLCKENFQQCPVPVHIPMFPSPYPSDPNNPPSDPIRPAPTTPTGDANGSNTPILAPTEPLPTTTTTGELPGGIKEGGSGPEVIGTGQ
jgi:hypothetical protein